MNLLQAIKTYPITIVVNFAKLGTNMLGHIDFIKSKTKAISADSDRCNISGAVCLSENTHILNSLKPVWETRPGLVCDCLPSCNEMDITVIKDIAKRFVGS